MTNKDNVVDFLKRLGDLQEELDESGYVPEDEDIESFLKVLDFLRTLSVSNDGRVEFDSETLRVILVSYVTEEEFGEEHLVTKKTAMHKETEMEFPHVTNSDADDEEECLIAAVEDFNDSLYALAQSFRDEQEEEQQE